MISYKYKNAELLFVGINPHHGSFSRGVPFSNNKTFWYLLNRSGLIKENPEDLKKDKTLKLIYENKFNKKYKLGFVNLIDRPTKAVSELEPEEEIDGQKKIRRIIIIYKPKLVCFIGKIAYQKFSGVKDFQFGWQRNIFGSKSFLMHFPIRGKASVRISEFKKIGKFSGLLK
jgi:TDG/mug DNA glycosylase family protein